MKARIFFVGLVAVVIAISLFLTYIFSGSNNVLFRDESLKIIESKLAKFDPSKVNDCEIIMLQQNLTYAICTMKEDGTVVLYDNYMNCSVQLGEVKKCAIDTLLNTFKPGQYVGVQVNLQKLEIPYESYYVCVYSDFPLFETEYPKKYGETKPGIYYPSFVCSPPFNRGDYHHDALSGFVLPQKGKFSLDKVYVFDGSLPKDFDFKSNLDKGLMILNIEGTVI